MAIYPLTPSVMISGMNVFIFVLSCVWDAFPRRCDFEEEKKQPKQICFPCYFLKETKKKGQMQKKLDQKNPEKKTSVLSLS